GTEAGAGPVGPDPRAFRLPCRASTAGGGEGEAGAGRAAESGAGEPHQRDHARGPGDPDAVPEGTSPPRAVSPAGIESWPANEDARRLAASGRRRCLRAGIPAAEMPHTFPILTPSP